MKDPIVEEVRRYRMEHTRKFGGDLRAICADLRRIEEASGHKVCTPAAETAKGTKNAPCEKPGVNRPTAAPHLLTPPPPHPVTPSSPQPPAEFGQALVLVDPPLPERVAVADRDRAVVRASGRRR